MDDVFNNTLRVYDLKKKRIPTQYKTQTACSELKLRKSALDIFAPKIFFIQSSNKFGIPSLTTYLRVLTLKIDRTKTKYN